MTERSVRSPDLLRVVDRRTKRCCRCGVVPPAPDLYLCGRCELDPDAMRERRAVEEALVDFRDQRRALVSRFRWVGGWW